MKYNKLFLALCMFLMMLILPVLCVSAQDVDLSNMDNAQLMMLLQAIMQKLEQGESDGEAVTPVPEIVLTPEAAGKIFSIYENKKLILERMPDWYFNRGPNTVEEEDDNPPDNPGKKKKTPPECENYCAYEACPWADLLCYWTCYYSCLGEPMPDELKP